MPSRRIRSRTFLAVVVAVLAAGTTGGALAIGQSSGAHASPELIRLGDGNGNGDPPAGSLSSVRESTGTRSGDYASPELLQLGYGPSGPQASG
jgi:hypothetical protein